MYNFDYDDMVKTGAVKPENRREKTGERKYAIMIKSAYASSGKFDITDAESVSESIYALEHNQLPDVIKKSARYFVKQAADYFGIPYVVEVEPSPHEIIVSDIVTKTAEHKDVPMLTFNNRKFVLDSEYSIKQAEAYFLEKKYYMPPKERISISRIIDKEASEVGHELDPATRAYSRAEYSDNTKDMLLKKASLSCNAKYAEVMTKLSQCYANMPVDGFLSMVEACDKAAELKQDSQGIPSDALLGSQDVVNEKQDKPDKEEGDVSTDPLVSISKSVNNKKE